MLLAYVDESCTKSRYYIGAVLVPEDAAIRLSHQLDVIVANAAAKHQVGLAEDAELHGYDIFQGAGDWKPLHGMLRARIGVYAAAFEAIAAAGVSIIVRGVDSARLRGLYSSPPKPHSIVLTHLLERIDEYAERHNELALVIADEPGQHIHQHEYRTDLRYYQHYGTAGQHGRRLARIVDTLHFAPSGASRLVQAADLVAFMHRRIETTDPITDSRSVRANADLWQLVTPRIEHCGRWDP